MARVRLKALRFFYLVLLVGACVLLHLFLVHRRYFVFNPTTPQWALISHKTTTTPSDIPSSVVNIVSVVNTVSNIPVNPPDIVNSISFSRVLRNPLFSPVLDSPTFLPSLSGGGIVNSMLGTYLPRVIVLVQREYVCNISWKEVNEYSRQVRNCLGANQ